MGPSLFRGVCEKESAVLVDGDDEVRLFEKKQLQLA